MKDPHVTYSVILPTFNEAENIPYSVGLIIEAFEKIKESFEIIVVDDGSPDGTAQVVRLCLFLLLTMMFMRLNLTGVREATKGVSGAQTGIEAAAVQAGARDRLYCWT
eukprot:GHVU01234959.1.p2 GENE.GHVU01234959.1~~GHVU01234959.1.p2  ORF type:complete len:108 (+),score=3.39 GHVU01234959.1:100-423(+)